MKQCCLRIKSYVLHSFSETIIQSLQVVVEVLDSFKKMSEATKSLDTEKSMLARLIYRSNNQFRSDKRLQMMKKVSGFICLFVGLDLFSFLC